MSKDMPKFPDNLEELNRMDYLINWDCEKGEHAIYRVVELEGDLSKSKYKAWICPVDVYDDGKYLNSETTRIKRTPQLVSIMKECLVPFGKGTMSKDFTVWMLFPPTLNRFPQGLKSLTSYPAKRYQELLYTLQSEITQSETINKGLERQNMAMRTLIENNNYKNMDDIKQVNDFFKNKDDNKTGDGNVQKTTTEKTQS